MIRSLHSTLAGLVVLAATQVAAVPPPPPELKELMDVGHVRFEFYDPAVRHFERPGVTRFLASYQWSFRFDVRTRKEKGRLRVTVTPEIDQLEAALDHAIYLPEEYDNNALFQRSLVLHEFDHVAISTDPRPRRLVEHLVRKLTVVEKSVPADQPVNESVAREIVNEELARRQEAVRTVMDFNNRHLDALSSYGNRALEDRKRFFARLYTRENLEEAEFPYLSEVVDLVRRPDYQNIDLARQKALRPRPGANRAAAPKP